EGSSFPFFPSSSSLSFDLNTALSFSTTLENLIAPSATPVGYSQRSPVPLPPFLQPAAKLIHQPRPKNTLLANIVPPSSNCQKNSNP
ncbi:hypothetical protein B0O80DRAFT_466825, partial [Mortierella sp. GBAus27b]